MMTFQELWTEIDRELSPELTFSLQVTAQRFPESVNMPPSMEWRLWIGINTPFRGGSSTRFPVVERANSIEEMADMWRAKRHQFRQGTPDFAAELTAASQAPASAA